MAAFAVIPDLDLTSTVTHVVLAFMQSGVFNEKDPDPAWPLFLSVDDVRSRFQAGTKVMVAIGGWGDTEGFATAARDEASRQRFAGNVAKMVEATGADGVDIDWEYPGGNGEDYKQTPNPEKAWEAAAYPQLLAALRRALGPSKLISAAVPGIPRDIVLAFTPATVPAIMASVDFLNIMTYDLMNRRDTVTKHHTGVAGSLETLDAYLDAGAPAARLNLGFAFYVKYFRVPHRACKPKKSEASSSDPAPGIGCPTGPMEDPDTGADLGRTGGFSYHDAVPAEVADSFRKALSEGAYDEVGGGYYYLDDDTGMEDDDLFWTFDTPDAIAKKFPLVVEQKGLGGVFAWGLGEDAPEFAHLKALADGVVRGQAGRVRDEL
ncbi:glycoside hydrolase [Apiospora marii]|uniref:glycoside hydrolase n=1 Tax=Apiospora marii TaxID=335849 RepID=UPI0031303257